MDGMGWDDGKSAVLRKGIVRFGKVWYGMIGKAVI